MTTKTKQALRAALETPAFAGVRAALAETANDAFEHATQTGRFGSTLSVAQCWRNDGWPTAWREIFEDRIKRGLYHEILHTDHKMSGDVSYNATCWDSVPCFVFTRHGTCELCVAWNCELHGMPENAPCLKNTIRVELRGDALAAALRDYALEGL